MEKKDAKENVVDLRAERLSLLVGQMIGRLSELLKQMGLCNRFFISIISGTLKDIHNMAIAELDEAQCKLERLANGRLKAEWIKKDEKENVNPRAEKLLLIITSIIDQISGLLDYIQSQDGELLLDREVLIEIYDMAADELNELYYNDVKSRA